MESVLWKGRISVLWIFMAVSMSAHGLLFFMEPGAMEEIQGMAMGPGMFFFMALFYWVPLVMAFLSLSLKDAVNRKVNLVIGGVFTILNIVHFIEHLAQPSAHMILLMGSTVVATALIVWHAWKWPKKET